MLLQERYRIASEIGRGGMGAVYLAEDLRLHTTVALKQMLVSGNRLSEAFDREAQLLAALRHPTIPRVIDHFIDQHGQFLVMEYIPGDDVATLLANRGQPFGLTDVMQWADQLLAALDYLHTATPQIIHRDIKPQNLKLTAKNEIVLLDFGLAKTSLASSGGQSDSIFGYTPHYAPLEQIQGKGTDPRTDLFSLAATLYHLLSGTVPIDALTRAGALVNQAPDPLPPINALNPQVPPAVADVLMAAMAQRADDRPQSAAEMRERLAIAFHDSPSLDRPTRRKWLPRTDVLEAEAPTSAKSTIRLPRPATIEVRRRPAWQLAAVGAVVVATIGAGSFALLGGRASSQTGQATPPAGTVVAPVAAVEPMSGSLNIAVANFVPADATGCTVKPDEAQGLATVVYQALVEQMQSARGSGGSAAIDLGDIEIRAPEQTGALDPALSTTGAAAEKARALNADVVLYGDVSCQETPRQTRLRPQIYLSDRKLQSFDQLLFIGEHSFGPELVSPGLPTSGPARQAIAEGLLPRMSVLTQFLVGLDYFYAGQNDQAAAAFSAANNVAEFDDPFITMMVTQFQGTTAARRAQYDEAQASYRKVLSLDADNPTALYSLANTTFLAARGDCTPDASAPGGAAEDTAGLNEALDLLGRVEAPDDTQLDKTIRGMTSFNMGEIYVCMAQAQIADKSGATDHWAAAEEQYKQAISLLDRDGAFTKDFLAEAHAGLALVYLVNIFQQSPGVVEAQWRRSAVEYCEASKLSGYAERQAMFRHRLAAIHGYLGEYDQAMIERQKALEFDPSSEQEADASLHKQWLADKETKPSKAPIWSCEQDAAR
jgi:tetratricopeptide (TPR) repeat protein